MNAYSELYLDDAKNLLAVAFEYSLNILGVDVDGFERSFLNSPITERFEIGNPSVVAGMSGVEYAQGILSGSNLKEIREDEDSPFEFGIAYWTGYVLAHYQWKVGVSFRRIIAKVRLKDIMSMYPKYHETDIERFIEEMDRRMSSNKGKTNLRVQREYSGLSQRELSRLSGVSIRSIQLYEQRVNDIDKAQGHTLYKLAWALRCKIEDILELPHLDR